jgi:hypothetical protein
MYRKILESPAQDCVLKKRRTRKKLVFEAACADVEEWDYREAILPLLYDFGLIKMPSDNK